MVNKLEFLKGNALLRGLPEATVAALAPRVFEKRLERDEMVFNEGDPAGALYFVTEGVIKIFKTSAEGKEQILALMRPGDFFNDVPLLDGGSVPASAQAMGQVFLYGIEKGQLEIMLRQHPLMAGNMLRMLAQRIRYLMTLVEDLSFRPVAGRVARILLENTDSKTQPGPRLTQRDMAALAGTAREVVSRSLKFMEDEGLIEMRQHRIVIKNIERLKELVGPAA
jgi:CRP/FNR family transcriptional regulator, cyclic AMP receptor protein